MSEAPRHKVAATLEPLGWLSGTAASRYATAAASVLAPKVVPQALKVAGHTPDARANPRKVAIELAVIGKQFGAYESVWTERVSAEVRRWSYKALAKQLPALIALVRSDEIDDVPPSEGMNRSIG